MTPEERAEMEAAKAGEAGATTPVEGEEAGTGVNADVAALSPNVGPTSTGTTAAAATATATGAVPSATHAATAHAAQPSNSSLAHHSSFSSSNTPTPSASTSDFSKTSPSHKDRKGKHKLTAEQKVQLDALEKKRDEEKNAR